MLGTAYNAGSPPTTKLLYTGQQFDVNMQQYYLRARYYNPANGRFNQMDSFKGRNDDPQSLHKYEYAAADPENGVDPSGLDSLLELIAVTASIGVLGAAVGFTVRNAVNTQLGVIAPSVRRTAIAALVRTLGDRIEDGGITEGEAFARVVGYVAEVNTNGAKLNKFDFFNDLSTMAIGAAGNQTRRFCLGDDDVPAGYQRDGRGREGWLLDHTEDASFKGGNGAPGTVGPQTGRVDHFVGNAGFHFGIIASRDDANELSVSMGSNVGFGSIVVADMEWWGIDRDKGNPAPGTDNWWDLKSNQFGRQFAEWVYYNNPQSQQISAWVRSNVLSP